MKGRISVGEPIFHFCSMSENRLTLAMRFRPFVLITGTVIGLLLLIGGSIALLYSIGGHELPSTLLGSTPGDIRKQ